MTIGFLSEPNPEHIAHSRMSAHFAAPSALHDWATFMTNYSAPTAEKFTAATQKWGNTARKDQTAYNIAMGTDVPFFEHIGQTKETPDLFARYMRSQGQSDGMALKHVLDGIDWARIKHGHIVDVWSISLSPTHPPSVAQTQFFPDTLLSKTHPSELKFAFYPGGRLQRRSRHISSHAPPDNARHGPRPPRSTLQRRR